MSRTITRNELIERWHPALERCMGYMAYPAAPFNQRGNGDPLSNRRLYEWLPLGLTCHLARGHADVGRIEALARVYAERVWTWEKPPAEEHRLLGEVHASIGISLALGYWPITLLARIKTHLAPFNPEWATDKLLLLATAWALAGRPDAAGAVVEELLTRLVVVPGEPKRGDETFWWPIGRREQHPAPMSFSHAGRVALFDWAMRGQPGDIYGMTAALRRMMLRDIDFADGATAEDMDGGTNAQAGQQPRARAMIYGYWPWLVQYMPWAVLLIATGRLRGTYRSGWLDNDDASHGLGSVSLIGAALAAWEQVGK